MTSGDQQREDEEALSKEAGGRNVNSDLRQRGT